jgi:predicted nucleic acid-binding protein
MRTALDTNILSALWSSEPLARDISASLFAARAQGGLVICAPVFVELMAHPSAARNLAEDFIRDTGIAVDFDLKEAVWRLTADSFAAYAHRRRLSAGDSPKRLLVDFIIGSHASQCADRLMTLDAQRFIRDFPKLVLI